MYSETTKNFLFQKRKRDHFEVFEINFKLFKEIKNSDPIYNIVIQKDTYEDNDQDDKKIAWYV